MTDITGTMKEALSLVPDDWEAMPLRFVRIGNRYIKNILHDRTFEALQTRGLVEIKRRAGQWEWRRADPSRDPNVEARRDALYEITHLKKARQCFERNLIDAETRIARIDRDIEALEQQARGAANRDRLHGRRSVYEAAAKRAKAKEG